MQAVDRPFTKIINGATQFIIPVFQRDYSWSEENCLQLWQDILAVGNGEVDRSHFIGSVVYVSTGDSSAGFTKWLLIDGQQRVTTLTLLLVALRDHIRETGWVGSQDGPTAKRIDAYFLRNVQEEGDREAKLVLRRRDDLDLKSLILGEDQNLSDDSLVAANYALFRSLIKRADPELTYRGVNRLIVVDVTLDRAHDDPQLVFESLNSTGVDLSQSDLIRNFILMGLKEIDQTKLYENYWAKIENLFRGSERTFDNFVRDYIAVLTKPSKLERSDNVYFAFRRLFKDRLSGSEGLQEFLEELLTMARFYAAYAMKSDDSDLGRALAAVRRLTEAPAITVMRLFDCHETKGTLSKNELLEALSLIESYLLRRAVLGEQTRGYSLEFAKLSFQIEGDTPLDSLKVAFARMPEAYTFPKDSDFKNALMNSDLYHKRVCFHVLDRLENFNSKEPSPTDTYTIEHVLPQNDRLSASWQAMLGDKWRDVQSEWLHRLGNLTLTGYNSAYSDRPFAEKKSIKGGFDESSVRLNKFIREQSNWSEDEMRARGEILADRAVSIWKPLDVDQSLVKAAEIQEKRTRASKSNPNDLAMTDAARTIFDEVTKRLRHSYPSLIEMAEKKSVSYHDPEFFLEIIPRKHGLALLLNADYSEVNSAADQFQDTSNWTFVTHATHWGGIIGAVNSMDEIDDVMAVIREVHHLTASH